MIALLLAALVAGGLLLGGSGSDSDGGGGAPAPAGSIPSPREVEQVARRVEAIRKLRFEKRPRPRAVTAAEARREGLVELDRAYPPSRRKADEELLKLLGLVSRDTDLRKIEASLFEGQVAGYYDTRKRRLSLVRGAGGGGSVVSEITLAHELVHALEDDRIGLDDRVGSRADADTAYTALVEGTATAVMVEYARLHIGPGEGLGDALAALGETGAGEVPPYLQRSFEFPYLSGQPFVERLFQVAGGDWKLVNHALSDRPPASSEQVIHPDKYLRDERPKPLTLSAAPHLRDGWRRISANTIGELDTTELLRVGNDPPAARRAAAGWGAGRFELWRNGPLPAKGCPAPCRARDALVAAWAWDTESDRREFERALTRYVEGGLGVVAGLDQGGWRLRNGGAAATASSSGVTTLALAPNPRLARRLARRAASPNGAPGRR